MHIPDGYLSPSTCAGLYAAAAPFWYVALRRLNNDAQHAHDSPAFRVCRLLFRHHDVQPPFTGRHHRTRSGDGNRGHCGRAVGIDSCHLRGAGDSGCILRRRRHHCYRGELLQHGHRWVARCLCGVSAISYRAADYVHPAYVRGRPCRLCSHQRCSPLRRSRIWCSATLLPRRLGISTVLRRIR